MARRDNHGNAVSKSGHRLVEPEEQLFEDCLQVDHRMDDWAADGFEIVSIRLKPPVEWGGEWMCVLSVRKEAERLVSFTTSDSLAAALHLCLARLLNGSSKWKEDSYAQK